MERLDTSAELGPEVARIDVFADLDRPNEIAPAVLLQRAPVPRVLRTEFV
jgi:hypothetical protein